HPRKGRDRFAREQWGIPLGMRHDALRRDRRKDQLVITPYPRRVRPGARQPPIQLGAERIDRLRRAMPDVQQSSALAANRRIGLELFFSACNADLPARGAGGVKQAHFVMTWSPLRSGVAMRAL